MRRRSAEICVYVPTTVALYILNQKRHSLVELETRYDLRVLLARDDTLIPPAFRLERLRAYSPILPTVLPAAPLTQAPDVEDEDEEVEEEIVETLGSDAQQQEREDERGRSRRRRKRRRRRDDEPVASASAPIEAAEDGKAAAGNGRAEGNQSVGDEESDAERRRRRGRRGGRRRAQRNGGSEPSFEEPRSAPDLVTILPAPGVAEPEPVAVEAIASAPTEAPYALTERVVPPEFASETPHHPGGTQTGREIETTALERVAAIDEPRAEVSGGLRGESSGWVPPYPGSLETAGAEQEQAAGVSPARPPGETALGQPIGGESEPASQSPSAHGALPLESVNQVSEKPANPRRGWWQRLIPS